MQALPFLGSVVQIFSLGLLMRETALKQTPARRRRYGMPQEWPYAEVYDGEEARPPTNGAWLLHYSSPPHPYRDQIADLTIPRSQLTEKNLVDAATLR